MLKTHMAACLVATALAAAPAFAQSTPAPSGSTDRPTASGSGSTTSGSSAMQPSTGATVSGAPSGSGTPGGSSSGSSAAGSSGSGSSGSGSSGGSSGASPGIHAQTGGTSSGTGASSAGAQASGGAAHFITQQQPGTWLASKLIGTTVVSANNESIGDVNDVLMDRGGQAVAVIVGVGGFLGIGEKDVAVSFHELEFTSRGASSAGTSSATGSTTRSGTSGTTGDGAAPDRIVLRLTKQDLQNAPRFARADRHDSATGSTAPGANRPAGTAAPK